MSFDGTWNLEISSPMGAQKSTFDLKVEGNVLTGTLSSPQGPVAVENGKVEGDHGTWSSKVTMPMPMTLEFDVTCNGDTLSGMVKAGVFGKFPVAGVRA
jgi:hypothetical protein